MKQLRLVSLLFLAASAMGLVGTSQVLAAIPTFKPATKQTLKFLSTTLKLEDALGGIITCEDGKGNGTVTGAGTVGLIQISFFHCEGGTATVKCGVRSVGSTNGGEIQFNTLKGELGEVTAGATSKSGLYLVPESGNVFTTAEGSCINAAALEGGVVGEFTPVRVSQVTNKLVFLGGGGSQSIKAVTTKAGGKTPSLIYNGGSLSVGNIEELTFSNAIEVT